VNGLIQLSATTEIHHSIARDNTIMSDRIATITIEIHSGLIPALLTTFDHFTASARM